MRVHLAAVASFAFTWLTRFLALVGFPNDHFLYLAPAQQMLAGELPSKDFVDPGTPLMYAVSAAARLAVESPLLAEALVVSTAFALAAALTVYAAFRASGSVAIAVLVTIAEVAMFPRAYHYPKLLLYAAGVLAIWRYIDQPPPRRATLVAACVVIAFLFRHDHGVYLAAAAITAAALAGPGGRQRMIQIAEIVALVAVFIVPYVLYVEATTGIEQHIASGVAYSRVEMERTTLAWPPFDLRSIWSPENGRVWLFYTFHLLPLVAVAAAVSRRMRGTTHGHDEWPKILALSVLAIAVNLALLRDPLQGRLPDVAVPACILAAWLMPQAWYIGTARVAVRALVIVVAAISGIGVNVVGIPAEQANRAGFLSSRPRLVAQARERVAELRAPFAPRQLPSRIIQDLVPFLEYLRRCTAPDHRLFVAGDAPEIYVFARRLFAGGQPALRAGFFSTIADQRRLVLRMRRQQVPLALVLTEADRTVFPLVIAELETEFRPLVEIPVEGRGNVVVRIHRRFPTHGVDPATKLPCFT